VTADEARVSHWSDLVNGLLDARSDPATARFDAELASAVATGELSRRTAQRLRFWQRAAVNAADDHARTVVPAVLGVLETARSDAQAYVEQGGATLDAAEAGGTPAQDLAQGVADDATWVAEPAHLLGADPPTRPSSERPRGTQGQPSTAAQLAEQAPRSPDRIEDLRRASSAAGERPSTLEGPAPRLFVADLRDVPATDRS
jgi:hypothetical protein